MGKMYLIQDLRDCVGNCASWWRPNAQGYTCNLDEAGRYTEAEATRITEHNPHHDLVPEEIALAAAVRHVRVDTNDGRFCLRRKRNPRALADWRDGMSNEEMKVIKVIRDMLAADISALRDGKPERVISDLNDCIYRLSELIPGSWDYASNKPIGLNCLPLSERQ